MKIAIIGAGLAGLTVAYELRGTDAEVDVYEATDRIGGKLHTVAFEGGPTDMGAEAFMARRQDAVDFFTELGLEDSLVEPSGLRSLVWVDGEARQLPTGGIMGIPGSSETVAHLVSEETVKRIDGESTCPGFTWPAEGDLNVGALVRERYGDEVVDNIVSALLGGVYSCTADDLGVRATIPQLAAEFDRLAAESGGRTVHLSTAVKNLEEQQAAKRKELPTGHGAVFNAFREGYQEVYEILAEKSGADIYIDAFISGIERVDTESGENNSTNSTNSENSTGSTGSFRLKGGEDTVYDHVVLAVPAPTAALLLKQIAPEASQSLSTVKLANSTVVGMRFATDKGLPENSGVLVATGAEDVRTKAFTFSSRKWPHLAERGGALVRASFGRFGDDIAIRASEDDLVDWALDDLQTITGFDGRGAGLEEIYVQRWFGGLPRFDEKHVATVGDVDKRLAAVDGISVTGAWAGGVGVPAVIAHARGVARKLAH